MFHAGTMWSSLFSAVAPYGALELQNSVHTHTLIWLSSWPAQAGLLHMDMQINSFKGRNHLVCGTALGGLINSFAQL